MRLFSHTGRSKANPYRYDLAEEWLDWKGLPFVFAVWMVNRKSLDERMKESLAGGLRVNLARNMENNLKTIADKRAHMGMSREDVAGYLRGLRLVLDEEDMEAIRVFRHAWLSLTAAKEATV